MKVQAFPEDVAQPVIERTLNHVAVESTDTAVFITLREFSCVATMGERTVATVQLSHAEARQLAGVLAQASRMRGVSWGWDEVTR